MMCHIWGMRRDYICLYLGPANRAELQALLTDRNTPRKLVWRAEIVLATADGCGTVEIMRRARTSSPPFGVGRRVTWTKAWPPPLPLIASGKGSHGSVFNENYAPNRLNSG